MIAKLRRPRNITHLKEENKIPEEEQNETEIASLSDAEFKTLVIRVLIELIDYSKKKIREEMKVTLNEIKKNLQGANHWRE